MASCCKRTKIMDPYKEEVTELLYERSNISSAIVYDRF
jgi:hypothetical protein